MGAQQTSQITALRRAIDCLPAQTRRAMLIGISNNTIVVGAYAIDQGVCPMLAAHRNGGRTNFVAFARTWDEYCFRGVRLRRRRPRLATATELATLRAHIEASLLAEDTVDLAGAMADHRGLVAQRAEADRQIAAERSAAEHASTPPARTRGTDHARPGDPDRSKELSRHHGWRWLRIMRSYDEYEQAMAELDATDAEAAPEHAFAHSHD